MLDHNSHIPLHVQIKNILEEEILKGYYTEKIPGELELMERFSVARATLRQSIKALVDEGILERIHGKGTFVCFKPVEEWLGSFSTYREIIENMGMKPNIKVIDKGVASSPKETANTLGVDEFFYIKRIRYAEDTPIGVEYTAFPLEIGTKISECDLSNSTYSLLEDNVGIKLWDAKQIITAREPYEEECELLGIPKSMWVLAIERINYDQNGNTIEYEQTIYRPDMYAFVVHFNRRS